MRSFFFAKENIYIFVYLLLMARDSRSQAPILSLEWAMPDVLLTGSADNTLMMTDLNTQQCTPLGAHGSMPHAAPVKCLAALDDGKALLSAGWDAVACLWQGGELQRRIALPDRAYCVSARGHWLVVRGCAAFVVASSRAADPASQVGCANRHIRIFDLRMLDKPFRDQLSPLKLCVAPWSPPLSLLQPNARLRRVDQPRVVCRDVDRGPLLGRAL